MAHHIEPPSSRPEALHATSPAPHPAPDRGVGAPGAPRHVGLRETITGSLGLFAILGLALSILAFASAFALADQANEAQGGGDEGAAAEAAAAALPVLVIGLLPLLASPLLALACGAWSGHASRSARTGAIAGAIAGLAGPVILLLIVGIGFALGAGAANLDLSAVNLGGGLSPGWGSTMPAIFSGSGLLYLLSSALAGALAGGLVGSVLEGRRFGRRAGHSGRARRPARV